ncbi:MAG: hypothetical protein P1V18_04920 [Candidatus Gracilibacteria bacterium]|nr:hypothetical protein [Candidatus Gracilibacteria bacterium]
MNVHYAHICEKAFLSQNGNLNLIGIFENIASQQFPITFPQVAIVTSLEGEVGEHTQQITVINEDTGEEVIKPIAININVAAKEGQTPDQKPGNLRILGDINNLTLPVAGKYLVQISIDGEMKYTIPFKALLATKPIPEGR